MQLEQKLQEDQDAAVGAGLKRNLQEKQDAAVGAGLEQKLQGDQDTALGVSVNQKLQEKMDAAVGAGLNRKLQVRPQPRRPRRRRKPLTRSNSRHNRSQSSERFLVEYLSTRQGGVME